MIIKNKNILVTGASDGIGKSTALALSNAGAHVILLGRNEEKLTSVSASCPGDTTIIACDITDQEKFTQKINEVVTTRGIDVLINNAGIWHKADDITDISEETIQDIISTNLTAHILITKQLLPHMREKESAILNIISKAGVVPQKGLSVYSASKYGMRGFTDVLREDTTEDQVRIGAIYQAGTKTDMFKKSGQIGVPVEKFTDPDDLANVIIHMLSQPDQIWLKEIHVEY